MNILLFDMDGVLLHPKAYHRALSETIAKIGRSLGYRNPKLSNEDIDVFESVGVTSEWESSAICTVLMLREVWSLHPSVTIPNKLPLPEVPIHELNLPDFQSFFSLPEMTDSPGERGHVRALRAFEHDSYTLTAEQLSNIKQLLDDPHKIHRSIQHRIFQELALGSRMFQDCYGLDPYYDVLGYLQTEDVPSISWDMRDSLLSWLEQDHHHAAVFTLRPSKPPGEIFDSPEAEMGLKVVDLQELPLVGHGAFLWLASESGWQVEDLIKPAPVHVLAAIRHSLGDPLTVALSAAADFALNGKMDDGWLRLDGAQVVAFEDSITGFLSATNAQRVLSEAGMNIELRLMGISTSNTKQEALKAAGAYHVFDDVNRALESIL